MKNLFLSFAAFFMLSSVTYANTIKTGDVSVNPISLKKIFKGGRQGGSL